MREPSIQVKQKYQVDSISSSSIFHPKKKKFIFHPDIPQKRECNIHEAPEDPSKVCVISENTLRKFQKRRKSTMNSVRVLRKKEQKSPSSFMKQFERTTSNNAPLLPNSQPQNPCSAVLYQKYQRKDDHCLLDTCTIMPSSSDGPITVLYLGLSWFTGACD